MRRAVLLILSIIAAASPLLPGPAVAADQVAARNKRHLEALPVGLPRPHYRFRTTIVEKPAAPVIVVRDPESLISPPFGPGSYIANLPGAALLPGSSTLPGYYGRAFDYDYRGPYYGGPYVPYWDRLPYACGVYGYC